MNDAGERTPFRQCLELFRIECLVHTKAMDSGYKEKNRIKVIWTLQHVVTDQ